MALDSWYAAVLELENCRDQDPPSVRNLVRCSARVGKSFIACLAECLVADRIRALWKRRRWRSWTGCWYQRRFGRGGVNVDWRGWYRGRFATWSQGGTVPLEGPSAAGELAKLDSGRLDRLGVCPAYWLS